MGAYRGKIDELPGFAKATPWQASFDRQIVELGGCAAGSVDYSTVPAPGFASRCARLLPDSQLPHTMSSCLDCHRRQNITTNCDRCHK